MAALRGGYYLPEPTRWPILGSIALSSIVIGLGNWLHNHWYGPYLVCFGFLVLVSMMLGWFGTVIQENERGVYNLQVDRSFRWGMAWFIFTEVIFFSAFFSALFYARLYTVPELGGGYGSILTHYLLWPDFKIHWPLLMNPDNQQFLGPRQFMHAWGVPAINTLVLLTSGATVTWAHWALKKNNRTHLLIGLFLTIALGVSFLLLQVNEYGEAYTALGLKLNSGIYGTTFFMLTGFHGAHVTIGTVMLIVIFLRSLKGHFTPQRHFAFEAVSWYWHFVDVVWLFLFLFVYWL